MNSVRSLLSKALFGAALIGVFAAPAAAQELKIGVVNIPLLMDRAPQTQAAMTALEEEFQPRQRDILAKQKELEDLTARTESAIRRYPEQYLWAHNRWR